MGKKQDAIFNQILQTLTKMQQPEQNPAQNALTQEALAGADFFKKGDFSALPKGMFFDFKMPGEEIKKYRSMLNVGDEGTMALGADSGGATSIAKEYLGDKFARDAASNYQDNISNAAGNVRGALAQAAGAKGQTDQAVVGGLQNLYSSIPKTSNNAWIGGLINAGTSIATKFL